VAERALAGRFYDPCRLKAEEAFTIENVHVLPGAPGAFRKALDGAIAAGLFGHARRWAECSLTLAAEEPKISEALRRTHAEFPEVMVGAYPAAEQNGSGGRLTVDFVSLEDVRLEAARAFFVQTVGLG